MMKMMRVVMKTKKISQKKSVERRRVQILRLGSRNTFSMLMQKSMARKSCSTQAQPAFLYTNHTRDIDTEPSKRTNWKQFKNESSAWKSDKIVSLVCYQRTDSTYFLVSNTRNTGIRDTANFEWFLANSVTSLSNIMIFIVYFFKANRKHASKSHQDLLKINKVMTMQKFIRTQLSRKNP